LATETGSQLAKDTLEVGHVLADYRITAILGQGGFGITYKAFDQVLEREVAIKEYLPRQFAWRQSSLTVVPRSDDDSSTFTWGLTRFVDEARALARFKHPNIVSVLRFLEQHGTAYLVMEYEEGKDLERWVKGRSDAVPESTLVDGILMPLLDGLERVHDKGLLHRDIKPENIFIRRDGSPVLIDFGASRAHGAGAASQLTSIISAGYSPFEQYGNSSRQGPWTDLYALAGTIYRVITGNAPVDAIARQQGQPMVPAVEAGRGRYSESLLAALDRALAIDPAERPRSAGEMRVQIRGNSDSRAPADSNATQVNPRSPRGRQPRRAPPERRTLRWSAAALLVMVVAAAAVWYLAGPQLLEPTAQRAQPGDAAVRSDEPAETRDEPAAGIAAVPEDLTEPVPEQDEPSAQEPEPEPDPEQLIVSGLDMPDAARDLRGNYIRGALAAYAAYKDNFDACVDTGCPQQVTFMTRLQQAQEEEQWEQPPFKGSVRIANPRSFPDSETCPHLLEVHEQIETSALRRTQVRTYCQRAGYERVLQSAGPVQDHAMATSS
jgi:hypothetical protein